ncbi:MAG: hypothetical protein GVY32_10205, partial [Gammaproteobacteria bacterium]|nr:hypothetical protein [Gammaproteobacteria bacterium]
MFTRIFLFLFAGLITGPAGAASNGGAMTESKQLIDFEATRTAGWQVVNDGVMGGRSRGHVEIDDGVLRFNGTLVTQGGGFTSVRASVDFDLSDYEGLELRVRGNGRIFEVEVNDGQRYGWRSVSRRAPFETGNKWRTVRVPFSALRATVFGRAVDVPTVKLAEIEQIGVYILDGKDGP